MKEKRRKKKEKKREENEQTKNTIKLHIRKHSVWGVKYIETHRNGPSGFNADELRKM
jgi:hypothetical protein